MLHMIKNYGIYLKKQSAKFARILNVPDAALTIRSLYKLLSTYLNIDIFRTLSNI